MNHSNTVVALLFLTLSLPAIANDLIKPVSSDKAIEIQLNKKINSKLGIKANLHFLDEKKENARSVSIFSADIKKNIPKRFVFIDTKILAKNKKEVLSQVITIASTAEIQLILDNKLKLLEWANMWNSQALPFRVQFINNNVLVVANLLTVNSSPLLVGQVLTIYMSVIQSWPAVIESLKNNNLLKTD